MRKKSRPPPPYMVILMILTIALTGACVFSERQWKTKAHLVRRSLLSQATPSLLLGVIQPSPLLPPLHQNLTKYQHHALQHYCPLPLPHQQSPPPKPLYRPGTVIPFTSNSKLPTPGAVFPPLPLKAKVPRTPSSRTLQLEEINLLAHPLSLQHQLSVVVSTRSRMTTGLSSTRSRTLIVTRVVILGGLAPLP